MREDRFGPEFRRVESMFLLFRLLSPALLLAAFLAGARSRDVLLMPVAIFVTQHSPHGVPSSKSYELSSSSRSSQEHDLNTFISEETQVAVASYMLSNS